MGAYMFAEKKIPIFDFVSAISETADLVSPALNLHHQKVAYAAYKIAQEMGISGDELQDIVLASMLHDIGAFSIGERIKLLRHKLDDSELTQHALLGYKLIKNFTPLSNAAALIKYHHTVFDQSKRYVPMGSYIIHLADSVCLLVNEQREILSQVPEVIEKIIRDKNKYHPDTLMAFSRLTTLEYFWVEAFSPGFSAGILQKALVSKNITGIETLRDFARVIAQIIDFRSRFTATHSSGVAAVAMELAAISGFSENECKLIEIAGFLHDLGKLSVSNDILEKNGTLNDAEYNSIRKHPYYTYAVLKRINSLGDIAGWAAYHHERQDGDGYPFHVKGEDFLKPARIMAVADILTALTEDRPYRQGMCREQTAKILVNMAESGAIDMSIVEMANKNFLRINDTRTKAQQEARNEYVLFHETINKNYISSAW